MDQRTLLPPSVEIKPLSLSVATYVAAYANDDDRREHDAMFDGDIVATVAKLAVRPNAINYAVFKDGNPEYVFGAGFEFSMPHLAQIWGISTERADTEFMKSVAPFVVGPFRQELVTAGVRRAEVRVLKDNIAARLWLTRYMRATVETELPNYGRHGETFIQMSWQHIGRDE